MATDAAIQASLDATGKAATIVASNQPDATNRSCYVVGLAGYAGRARWINILQADAAATAAAAIVAGLNA